MIFIGKKRVDELVSKGAILADMRSPVMFRDDPIPGAVNLPLRNLVNTLTLSKSTNPKQINVVLFSNSRNDEDIAYGIKYAENLGFNVYVSETAKLKETDGSRE